MDFLIIFFIKSQLYFAGDFVRTKDLFSPAIARYDFDDDDYLVVADGIQLISKTLPTSDEDLSPSLLFSSWDDKLLLAGHFDIR